MITLHMIVELLGVHRVDEVCIADLDAVGTARLLTDAAPLREGVLYLSPSAHVGHTRCNTKNGSSFLLREELNPALNAVLDALQFYRDWEDRLREACRRGCTLTELLDIGGEVIAHPMFILDSNEWMTASSSAFGELDDPDWTDMVCYGTSKPEKIAAYNQIAFPFFQRKTVYRMPGDVFSRDGYAYNLFHDRVFCGVMVLVCYGPEVTQGGLDAFEFLGTQIRKMINDPSSSLSDTLSQKPLLNYLENPAEYEHLARSLHISLWEESDPKLLLYAAPLDSSRLAPNPEHSRIIFSRLKGIVAASYQQALILLCNRRLMAQDTLEAEIPRWLGQISYCAGASDVFTDLRMVHTMLRQAHIAWEHGEQRAGALGHFRDHVFPYLLRVLEREAGSVLVHPCLELVREYDRHHGSKLYETLFAYLENERSLSKTAAALNVHRSTLIHRLERLEEVLPISLDVPEVRIHLLLSFYAQQGTAPEQ